MPGGGSGKVSKIMGASASAAPPRGLNKAALMPMQTLDVIDDNDEYWGFLFSRIIITNKKGSRVLFIGEAMKDVYRKHPNTVKQMVRIGLVRLIDLVHQCELESAPDMTGAVNEMWTIATLISYALVNLVTCYSDCCSFLGTQYDDCGVVGQTLVTTLTRVLILNGVTVEYGEQCWCATSGDNGCCDSLRLAVVEVLVLLKIMRVEFLEFPKRAFAVSVVNCMKFYMYRVDGRVVMNERCRAKLIQISLCLLMWLGVHVTDFSECVPDVFQIMSDLIARTEDFIVWNTFAVPLTVEYMYQVQDSQISQSPLPFLAHLLHLADWWRMKGSAKVCLLMIARACQVPDFLSAMEAHCDLYESDWPVHSGSWGSVMLEIVVRIADVPDRDKLVKLAAVIGCLLFKRVKSFVFSVLSKFFQMIACQSDIETEQMVLKTVHSVLSEGISRSPILAVQMLREVQLLEDLVAKAPDFTEGASLHKWVLAQNNKLKSIKSSFSTDEIVAILSDKSNCVELQPPSEACNDIPFDFKSFYWECVWLCPSDYFEDNRNCTFSKTFLTNEPK